MRSFHQLAMCDVLPETPLRVSRRLAPRPGGVPDPAVSLQLGGGACDVDVLEKARETQQAPPGARHGRGRTLSLASVSWAGASREATLPRGLQGPSVVIFDLYPLPAPAPRSAIDLASKSPFLLSPLFGVRPPQTPFVISIVCTDYGLVFQRVEAWPGAGPSWLLGPGRPEQV